MSAEPTTPADSAAPGTPEDARTFWEERYRDSDRVWSGNPNPLLVREVAGLEPGRALDLGCGEGADAVWLAAHGWRVTGVDISTTALDRAAAHAEAEGVGQSVTWERHELGRTFPEGSWDLVSAQFLQSPVELDRERVLRWAASVVAPGGTLLVAMHASWPSWQSEHDHPFAADFPSLQDVLEELALPATWRVETLEEVKRDCPSPDGAPGTRGDNVWRLTRTA
ncbi:class I SAM-dependent methyltransferase [Streptomyces chumphonensis]|uniref:class I SAM-dependent methyltransferase n=1 Tax=Streptomyces chumphonensis TaxID=1214925 RepID=UPI003D7536B3